MKKKRFSEEQIIRILREAEKGELTVGDLCRKHAVSEQSFYRWRKKFGDMDVNDAKRLRSMDKENAQLKRLVAERDMEIDAMKDLLSKKW
jgi:putative transposase